MLAVLASSRASPLLRGYHHPVLEGFTREEAGTGHSNQ
ncbi:hypothetical protein T1E_3132 [Pseudomonas putida DOT-T1E]|uniref:Uncharacterized protein n=1 Tax=Pseudomonas putida (strain DOT-T1E) TaxID=1196325 RepID=I7CAW4_PSEPT|nr:hypothetical protein T1E_3132 [Pseudomonas putida DOT-T1E]